MSNLILSNKADVKSKICVIISSKLYSKAISAKRKKMERVLLKITALKLVVFGLGYISSRSPPKERVRIYVSRVASTEIVPY